MSQLKIFGTWFSADMRTVCSILDIAGKPYSDESELFDFFDMEGNKEYT